MLKRNTLLVTLSALFLTSFCHLQAKEDKMAEKLQSVILELHEIGAIKFGSFKLKSGATSSVYVDLRLSISRPKLLKDMADLIAEKVARLHFDAICAVPYGALPLTTTLSIRQKWPLLMARKEVKPYGMGLNVEGIYNLSDRVLLVEDIMTTGSSIKDTAKTLTDAGFIVNDAVVFLNREEGGLENLKAQGIRVEAVLTLSELLLYKLQ